MIDIYFLNRRPKEITEFTKFDYIETFLLRITQQDVSIALTN